MTNLILLLIIMFLIAALLRLDFYFHILYFLGATYLLTRLWTQRASGQLTTARRFVRRAFPGEEVTVTVEVRNAGWLPVPWVEVYESLPPEIGGASTAERHVISLWGGAHHRLTYMLTGYRRGYYRIGPLFLRVGDLFGLMPEKRQSKPAEYLIIYPRIVALEALGLPTHSPLALLPSPSALFKDPTRIMGVRAYQPGDSPRRIHWTASASAGKLLVKRYEPAIARETLIYLDMDRGSYLHRRRYDAIEMAIVAAASLAHHIIVREGLPAGLAVQALDPLADEVAAFSLPPRSQQAHLMSILEVLARIQTHESDVAFSEFLHRESAKLSWGSTVVVITGGQSEALFSSLAHLRRMGFSVVLLLIMPVKATEAGNALQQRIASIGVSVVHIWRDEDLGII
ncbi:MAG: DUF58 domain-containing protein [Anaerolineales bacterium]